jgi:hypothetical protein
MKRQAIRAGIGLAVAGGFIAMGAIAVFLGSGPLPMGAVSATDGPCNTTVSSDPASAGDNSIRVDDPAGCDADDWIVVNEGGLTEECQQIKVLALNLHLNILFLYGALSHDHSVGETVVEVAQCPTPTPTATPMPPAPGQMHYCPEPSKWSIATWSGEDSMPIEEALAFCPQRVDAAYRVDPDTQAWTRYFEGRAEISNLAVIDDGQGVIALGAGMAAASAAGDEPLQVMANGMVGCPDSGKWAISVWTGEDGTPTDQALANCTGATVAAAYWIDPHTQAWKRYFDGRPEISNLTSLDHMQGVVALGGALQYEVTVQFNTLVTQDDIDEAAALLRAYDEDLEFLIMEIWPPIGRALLATNVPDFCQTAEAELEAESYIDNVSCGPA